MKTLILLALLLPMLVAKSTYFVAVPRVLFAGSYSTASISTSGLTKDATVTITLKQNGNEVQKFSKVLSPSGGEVDQISRIPFVVDARTKGKIQFHISSNGGLVFDHNTDLEVKVPKDRMFIQTDKPVYKPGGKIRFRIVGIDKDLKPNFPQPIEQIYILNPSGSRMMQWTNQTLDVGMASFEMPLSIKPVLGNWKIVAKSKGVTEEVRVEVKKYVLPKFKVEILPPSYIVSTDEKATVKICGKYTYGKKVIGKIDAKICLDSRYRWRRRSLRNKCIKISKKTDGCVDVEYPLRKFMKESLYYRNIRLMIEASVTEDATGIKVTSNSTTKQFAYEPFTMKFDAPTSYKPGFVFKVKLLINAPDGRPVTDSKFVVIKTSYRAQKSGKSVSVSRGLHQIRNGIYEFSVSPVDDAKSYRFEASEQRVTKLSNKKLRRYGPSPSYTRRADHTSHPWFSPSKRYLQITETANLNVGEIAKVTVRFSLNSNGEKTLNYMLVCKGVIVAASTKKTDTWLAYLRFRITDIMIPKCRLLVYYLHQNEFISDSRVINFGISFKNKVSLSFSDEEKKPGEQVDLTMKASPGSKFAVSAVDQSINLLGETNDIDESEIMSVLTEQDVSPGYQQRVKCKSKTWPFGGRRWRRSSPLYPYDYGMSQQLDGKEAIKQTGLKYFTNVEVDVLPCPKYHPWYHRHNIFNMEAQEMPMLAMAGGERRGFPAPRNRQNMMFKDSGASIPKRMPVPGPKGKPGPKAKKPASAEPALKVRTAFPESWLWFDEIIGSTGEKTMSVKVPDTITTWHANGFAMSTSDGIGIATTSSIRTFQPFFISLNLPYSVKRGETVKIPATVFNYLDKCLVIGISLKTSKDFTPMTSLSNKVCVCGGASKTVKFGIKATKLGKIDISVQARSYQASSSICGPNEDQVSSVLAADALTKKLLVEAEGIKKEYSKSLFFCPNDYEGATFKDKISLHLPKQVVPGSVYAELTVVGDLLGPSMSGLDKLLAMPYGCGEQNMLKFAPNVYIMDYLKATSQSDKSVESKAIEYMRSGYQRELTYKHSNGGYSAFGERDKEASTWLTAFVLRTYAQARRYIFIDPKDITDSRNWLLGLQNKDGCFEDIGMVHHKEMKGGVTSGITMTAFVVIALLEADLPHTDNRIKNAVTCIESHIDDVTDSYTTSVLAFALKMAKSDSSSDLLKKLKNQEIREDGLIHWEDGKSKKPATKESYYYRQAKSADIEMTAYALMAFMGGEKSYASRLDQLNIVKWLAKQRNAYGGFSSTQDTCVGLQALSQYSAASFSGGYDLTIKMAESSPSAVDKSQYEFMIDNNHKLVLQKLVLDTNLPKDIDIEAFGKGCALVQANVKYNEPKPGDEASFDLVVKVNQDENSFTCRHAMKICGSYTGKGKSNMALVDVTMVSGFEPIIDELEMLSQSVTVPFTQYEYLDGVLSFYFNDFEQSSKCIEFGIEQNAEVEDRKPATVKIYDYYDKDDEATKMYEVGKCPEVNIVT